MDVSLKRNIPRARAQLGPVVPCEADGPPQENQISMLTHALLEDQHSGGISALQHVRGGRKGTKEWGIGSIKTLNMSIEQASCSVPAIHKPCNGATF